MIKSGETLTGWKQRLKFWTALAILRCVMSSPAAARVSLENAVKNKALALDEEADEEAPSSIFESTDEEANRLTTLRHHRTRKH